MSSSHQRRSHNLPQSPVEVLIDLKQTEGAIQRVAAQGRKCEEEGLFLPNFMF